LHFIGEKVPGINPQFLETVLVRPPEPVAIHFMIGTPENNHAFFLKFFEISGNLPEPLPENFI
jgi:hypothetical protein